MAREKQEGGEGRGSKPDAPRGRAETSGRRSSGARKARIVPVGPGRARRRTSAAARVAGARAHAREVVRGPRVGRNATLAVILLSD